MTIIFIFHVVPICSILMFYCPLVVAVVKAFETALHYGLPLRENPDTTFCSFVILGGEGMVMVRFR